MPKDQGSLEELHEVVEEQASFLWEAEGRPEGRHLDHWLRAEAEATAPRSPANNAEQTKLTSN